MKLLSCVNYLCIGPKSTKCGLWESLGHFLCPNGPSDVPLITWGAICWGMLPGLGSDVIKAPCSVCFCEVKTNTSLSIWTQLWYFYLPHRLQAAMVISNLMKLMQRLASSCLFASEQTGGHLVQAAQTGSSWERCLRYHLHVKAQSCPFSAPPAQFTLWHWTRHRASVWIRQP